MVTWSPEQYLKFADERTRPSMDLAARIAIAEPRTVLDVGCGPGNSTRVLRQRWPSARVVGLDNSAEMIAQARRDAPDADWVLGDAAALPDAPQYEVVFSNAVIQWIPNPEALLPRLAGAVAPGGCLAVQVPANRESPLHRALLAVAAEAPWAEFTASCGALFHYRSAEAYYSILCGLGKVDLWETTYYHVLASHRDLIEWYKGSGMRPFLERLPEDRARTAFQEAVLRKCIAAYPPRPDGRVLYPFKRIFFILYR